MGLFGLGKKHTTTTIKAKIRGKSRGMECSVGREANVEKGMMDSGALAVCRLNLDKSG